MASDYPHSLRWGIGPAPLIFSTYFLCVWNCTFEIDLWMSAKWPVCPTESEIHCGNCIRGRWWCAGRWEAPQGPTMPAQGYTSCKVDMPIPRLRTPLSTHVSGPPESSNLHPLEKLHANLQVHGFTLSIHTFVSPKYAKLSQLIDHLGVSVLHLTFNFNFILLLIPR